MFDKIKDAAGNLGDAGEMGDLKKYVDGIDFPASKDEIINHLRQSGAKEDVIAKVQEVGKQQFSDQKDLLGSFMTDR